MFINMSGQGGDGNSIAEAIQAAIAQMMMGDQAKKNGRTFDKVPYRRAKRIVEEQNDTTEWSAEELAYAVLEIDPTVKGCCGQDECRMDKAIKAARKSLDLWTTEEAVAEEIQMQIPAIAEAVEERLEASLPKMMEEAAINAIKADRRNRWYNRALRSILGFVLMFIVSAITWSRTSRRIDEGLAEHNQEIEDGGLTARKVKFVFLLSEGLAFTLGYFAGMLVSWVVVLAILAGGIYALWVFGGLVYQTYLTFGVLPTVIGLLALATITYGLVLWLNKSYRLRVFSHIDNWYTTSKVTSPLRWLISKYHNRR